MYGEDVEPATIIRPHEAPDTQRADYVESIRDLFERFDVWNRGDWNGKWENKTRTDRRDRRAVFDAVVGQLELTDYQSDRAWKFYRELPDDTRNAFSVPQLVFCVAVLAAREDGRYYHPQASAARNDDLFEHIRRELGIPKKRLTRLYGRVKSEVEP